jgi:GntR family transcriptional regulator of arabinose operon
MPAALTSKTHRIKQHLLQQFADGLLRTGDYLPAESEIAKSLGVGRHSVRQALAELSDAGMIDRKQKRGTIVTLETPEIVPVVSGKRSGFALVIPEMRSGVYPSLIQGFNKGSAAFQQQSMVCDTEMDIYRQADAFMQLLHVNVAGIAVVPPAVPIPDYQVQVLRANQVPLVFCHRRTTTLKAPLIRWCWEEVGRLAAQELAQLGHRRIAFIDVVKSVTGDSVLLGARNELGRWGASLPDDCCFYGEHTLASASEAKYLEDVVARLLAQSPLPTAVICADDYISEQLYWAATRANLRVPEELSIIGFGPTFRDGPIREGLAVVAVDESEVGMQATRMLAEMIDGRRPIDDDEEITLPLAVLRGKTLAAPCANRKPGNSERKKG